MIFEVEIDGRMRLVSIESVAERFRVTVDDDRHEVSVVLTDLGLSLVYVDTGRSVDVAVTEQSGGQWFVQLPHVSMTAVIDGRRYERGGTADAAGAGEQKVVAPMPGRVVRLLVQPGDEVVTRQGLVVVEAMKMENELGSPKAGRVKLVAVTEGMSVEAGRLLVVVE